MLIDDVAVLTFAAIVVFVNFFIERSNTKNGVMFSRI